MESVKTTVTEDQGTAAERAMASVKEKIQACIQCGTCTGSCPNAFAMDMTPRRMWRLILLGRVDDVFSSHTFSLCSACYYCTLRCPRGLPLTEAMSDLKQAAACQGIALYRQSTLFYEKFLESVRRHGRVREMELMTLYFNAVKSPVLPFRFARLGLKLMRKGKVGLQMPTQGRQVLDKIYRKAAEMEAVK